MKHRQPEPDPSLDGPDYVTLLIEWDSLADDLERGTATASGDAMPTKDSDWMIDEAGKESFPASDPPAWGSSHASTSDAAFESLDEQPTSRMKRFRTPILLGVLGAVALGGLFVGIRYVRNR
jgi:hypothetical protein